MSLSAAQIQRKREHKAARRRYYAKRKTHFYQTFGPWVGSRMYDRWRAMGGWWPMRRGRVRKLIKECVQEFRDRLPVNA